MYARHIARRLLSSHGIGIRSDIHSRRTFYDNCIRNAEQRRLYFPPAYIPKYIARRMLWDAVLSHIDILSDPTATLPTRTIRHTHS